MYHSNNKPKILGVPVQHVTISENQYCQDKITVEERNPTHHET